MPYFRKKPAVIEALQFHNSSFSGANAEEIINFTRGLAVLHTDEIVGSPGKYLPWLNVPTLHGEVRADLGDWIIKGVKGDFYPCKPDVFKKTYDPVK
jgi:hypothetical protein